MKTSAQWWAETKADPEKLIDWLKRQYTGERTAVVRLEKLLADYPPENPKYLAVVRTIIAQEAQHADWVGELLIARGVELEVGESENRYWAETLEGIDSFDTGSAVAAHAEAMRLERIGVIANDEDAPADIREVFRKILPDEKFHTNAFQFMASEEALEATAGSHQLGLKALGLEA